MDAIGYNAIGRDAIKLLARAAHGGYWGHSDLDGADWDGLTESERRIWVEVSESVVREMLVLIDRRLLETEARGNA